MTASTGQLIVGMAGPREPVQLLFTDRTIDWTLTKSLTLTVTQSGGAVATCASWSWSYPDAYSAQATCVLVGTEITQAGRAALLSSLTVGGSVVGTRSWIETIAAR